MSDNVTNFLLVCIVVLVALANIPSIILLVVGVLIGVLVRVNFPKLQPSFFKRKKEKESC